jgi:nucleoside-diphosphate-sugar epimerase
MRQAPYFVKGREIKKAPFEGDAAEKEWGWRPIYSIEETVRDFIEECKKGACGISGCNRLLYGHGL